MRSLSAFPLRPAALLGGLVLLGSALRAADAPLTVIYDGQTTAFAAPDLAPLAHQEVTAFDFHDKKNHTYSGVPVHDLLARVGVPFGEKLRGKFLRMAVIAHTRDNYDIIFALAEFDDAFNSRSILLVDRQDGQPLGEALSPGRRSPDLEPPSHAAGTVSHLGRRGDFRDEPLAEEAGTRFGFACERRLDRAAP